MKSICIKTNNSNLLNYLLNELKSLDVNNVYFSHNKFKSYKNVIIHYKGDDLNLFLEKISSILSFLVIDELEEDILKSLISQNYFYFNYSEKNTILQTCFDLITDNFKYFRSIRGDKSYFVRGTFTAKNLDFSKDVLFMNDLGFDQISIEPVVLPEEHPLAIHESDLPIIFAEYEKLAEEYIKRRQTDKWFSFFHFVLHLDDGPCYKKRLVGCGAGSEYLAVAPNGDIYPCHQFVGENKYVIGNVNGGALNDDLRHAFARSSIFTKPECMNCWAKYHCSGGCNANAVHANGDMNKPYRTACEMMKKRLECSMYIFAKEKAGDVF